MSHERDELDEMMELLAAEEQLRKEIISEPEPPPVPNEVKQRMDATTEPIERLGRKLDRHGVGHVCIYSYGSTDHDTFVMTTTTSIRDDRDPYTLHLISKFVDMALNGHPAIKELTEIIARANPDDMAWGEGDDDDCGL